MSEQSTSHVLRLPQAIWARSGLPAEVPCCGGTVRAALDDACRQSPGLSAFLAPGRDSLPRSVLVFADGSRVTDVQSQELNESSDLRVVIPSAGG